MSNIGVKEAKAALSGLVDEAASGEFVTIARHGKPDAVLVSPEAASRAFAKDRASLVNHLKRFPGDIDLDGEIFSRNRMPSREIDLGAAFRITPSPSTAPDA